MQKFFRMLPAWLAMAAAAQVAPAPKTLRAGAHAVDITPRKLPIVISGGFLAATAEKLGGALHARAIALDDGERRVVIAVADSLMMPRELLDRVKAAAARKTGIPPERMLISATHTHSAPPVMGALGTDFNPEYAAFLEPRLVDAIAGALRNLAPASVGWTVVDAPEHTNNRRWILRPDKMRNDPFGYLTVRAHMHPGYQNPEFVGPSGPVDPAISLLALRSSEGRPIALLANYSMHYVGAGRQVSPDYYGPFVENMQRLIGAQDGPRPFVAMISQGTSGDLHWMDYGRPRKDTNPALYADALAGIAHQAYRRIEYRAWTRLAMAETKLRLRRRVPDSARLAWARELYERMAGALPRNQQEVYAREQVLLAAEPERELKLQALRIGDLGIAAIPNEVFAITGLKIKAQSPLQPTVNIELANGADGYIPPPEQHALGGYTTWPARTAGLEVNAEPRVVEAVLALLEKVAGKTRRPVEEAPAPYANAVLASEPLAYWRGGEFAGPVARDAGRNGNRALYEGGVAFYLEGPPLGGPPGANRAPHFAGGRMRAAFQELGDRYSVAMWFYNGMPADARPVAGTLFATGADGERLAIGGAGSAPGRLVFTSGGSAAEGATAIGPRTWHHLTLVRDGTQVLVYLDGNATPEIRAVVPSGKTPAAQFFIGGDEPSSSFEGRIDEIAIFGRPLPPEEAAGHYAAAR